jgi:hypothetical protein
MLRNRPLRALIALLPAVLALMFSMPASADAPIVPFAQCVWNNGDGTVTAVYGYTNNTSAAHTIAAGADNSFSPSPPGPNAGQPTTFLPGTHNNAFIVTYPIIGGSLSSTWEVQDVAATAGAVMCSTNPIPMITPVFGALVLIGCLYMFAPARRRARFAALFVHTPRGKTT